MPGVEEMTPPKAPAQEVATGNGPQVQPPEVTGREPTALTPIFGSPFAWMRRVAEEMDHLFEDFGLGFGRRIPSFLTRGHELLRREAGLVPAEWSPRVDVLQREGQWIIRADLPGVTKGDVKVELTEDTLTIEGERKEEKEERRRGYHYSERSYGRFYRTLPLPEGVDSTKATATFDNGVLEVAIPAPKGPEKQVRRLEIQDKK